MYSGSNDRLELNEMAEGEQNRLAATRRGSMRHKEGTQLKEHVDGEKHDGERERIARGGNHCRQDEQHHNGVTAVVLEKTSMQNAEFPQQPCQQGHFKHKSHDENEHEESVHVAVKRNLVGHKAAHMIIGKKPQRDRENDEVAHQDPRKKHDIANGKSSPEPSFLPGIEGGADKGPQQVEHDRKGEYQSQPKRGGHVDEKL